jgi:hypothetical protein
MSDLTTYHEPNRFEEALRKMSVVVDGVVAQQCARHYSALTQEHQFTSGLARAIELELERFPVEGLDIQVHAQEFPDRGRGSLEKPSGADLYISIVRRDGDAPVSKGMLVQSKWDRSLRHANERRDLNRQVKQMTDRSRDASYVWIYGPTGTAVFPARSSLRLFPRPSALMTVGELIATGVRCDQGDPTIGRNTELPLVESLNSIVRQVAAKASLSFIVGPTED